ncbi:hypothetical protein AB0942_33350 [Streptomyces nodosus]|uniref:hypothetical protein n=1 Tax=Streptomyces nodosus TaxID=40318 RepID=UPI00345562B6
MTSDRPSNGLFSPPELGKQAAYRLTEQDKKDLRIILCDRRETSVSNLLRSLVHHEAEAVRQRWQVSVKRWLSEERDV